MNELSPKCRLLELRKMLGLTQEQFANQVGINKNTISNVENSKNSLSIETAFIITKRFNLSLDWLYGLEGATKENNILDSFCSFFDIGECTIAIEDKTTFCENAFLTLHLSPVVRDYLLKRNEIEKINKEKDLPIEAYKAWLERVKTNYLKEIEENGAGKPIEFVLVENDENFGLDVAYAKMRRQLPDLAAKIALDKLNFDNE